MVSGVSEVVRFDDETREIAKEIVASGRMNDVAVALDFFDASINRIAAWVIGARNMQKALLSALLLPSAKLREYQDGADYTKMLALSEEFKTFPFGEVWDEYCKTCGAPVGMDWIEVVDEYEREVLSNR